MGKIVCEITLNGEQVLKSVTTLQGTAPYCVRTTPGVGKPFWYWASIPAGTIVACDFTNAPIASSNVQENAAAIAAITVKPEDVLIYDPPLGTT
jgi:hypothetical protein